MSILNWILLAAIFTLYLLLGGSVFMVLEQGNEIQRKEQLTLLKKDIQAILLGLDQTYYNNGTPPDVLEAIREAKEGVISRISETCGGINFLDVNSTRSVLRWTFYNSVFYAFTAITTIGYGNLAPESHWSRIFTIFYALIGIPINGILLTKLSSMYSRKLVKVHNKSKENDSPIAFAFNIIFYLIPGLLLFIIIPAAFFVVIEDWGYLDAIYFCFVSLTTIGFGDYVAGMGDGHNVWLWVYKIVIIFWIVFGLGYLVMILGFITKGITSKKVIILLEKKLNRIRVTKEKLTDDVEYIRKLVKELYLTEADAGFLNSVNESDASLDTYFENCQNNNTCHRSKSFFIPRGSFSGVIDLKLIRSFSESDLDRFSRSQREGDEGYKDVNCVFAELVASLEGRITDILDAVEDLNSYEAKTNITEVRSVHKIETDMDTKSPKDCCEAVHGIGDEMLLNSTLADGSNLEQIVVHKSEPSGGILDKVSGVLRKISSGNMKTPSEPSSRKVSRNESENKVATGSSGVLQIQNMNKPCYQNIQAGVINETSECTHTICNCDKENSRISVELPRNFSQTSCGSDSDYRRSENPGIPRRKSSKSLAQGQGRPSLTRHLPLDPNSLADLLKVLDDVQERLADDEECFPSSATPSSITNPGSGGESNFGFVQSNETSPITGRRCRTGRNRKVGIFNPDFRYFSPDLTGTGSRKLRVSSIDPH